VKKRELAGHLYGGIREKKGSGKDFKRRAEGLSLPGGNLRTGGNSRNSFLLGKNKKEGGAGEPQPPGSRPHFLRINFERKTTQ